MGALETANRFVAAINSHINEDCLKLMADDFRFIDCLGTVYDGRDINFWPDYFNIVPDYRINISETAVSGNTVVLMGEACGTYTPDGTVRVEDYWTTPAAWRAVIVDDKIKEWQVFTDNQPIRKIMRRYHK